MLMAHTSSATSLFKPPLSNAAEGPARGGYTDSRHTRSGWSVLHVHSNVSYSDKEQVLASA